MSGGCFLLKPFQFFKTIPADAFPLIFHRIPFQGCVTKAAIRNRFTDDEFFARSHHFNCSTHDKPVLSTPFNGNHNSSQFVYFSHQAHFLTSLSHFYNQL